MAKKIEEIGNKVHYLRTQKERAENEFVRFFYDKQIEALMFEIAQRAHDEVEKWLKSSPETDVEETLASLPEDTKDFLDSLTQNEE